MLLLDPLRNSFKALRHSNHRVRLFVAAMAYLGYQGIIVVNWDRLASQASNVTSGVGNVTGQATGAGDQLANALVNFGIPFTGTFAGAFIFGFMKG